MAAVGSSVPRQSGGGGGGQNGQGIVEGVKRCEIVGECGGQNGLLEVGVGAVDGNVGGS